MGRTLKKELHEQMDWTRLEEFRISASPGAPSPCTLEIRNVRIEPLSLND